MNFAVRLATIKGIFVNSLFEFPIQHFLGITWGRTASNIIDTGYITSINKNNFFRNDCIFVFFGMHL